MNTKLKILWIKFKSIVHLPIYRKDILIWVKYYYANEDYSGLCNVIEHSTNDLLHVYNRPQHIISLLSPEIVKEFYKHHTVNTNNKRSKVVIEVGHFWWKPYTWELNGGRLGFLNWLIEQYKDDKTNLRKL